MKKIEEKSSMEEKIKEVQEYFINKIVKHDYEIKDFNEYTCTISIDQKYCFTLWIANDFYIHQYRSNGDNCFVLREFKQKEKDRIANYLRKVIGNKLEEKEKEKKLAEYERLKLELGIDK